MHSAAQWSTTTKTVVVPSRVRQLVASDRQRGSP
jgi:hypothetical protein